MGQGAIQRGFRRCDRGLRLIPCGLRRDFCARIYRGNQGQLVIHVIEDGKQRRAQQHPFRHAQIVGVLRRQTLHQPHHVVAQIAHQPAGHRGQVFRHIELGFLDQRAQACQRRPVVRHEGVRRGAGVAIDLRAAIPAAPDQVRLHADDRISPARRAAFHAFQQERVRLAMRQLQECRDRRFQIGDAPAPDQAALSGVIGGAEGGKSGWNSHVHDRALD